MNICHRFFTQDRENYLAWCAVSDPFAADARRLDLLTAGASERHLPKIVLDAGKRQRLQAGGKNDRKGRGPHSKLG